MFKICSIALGLTLGSLGVPAGAAVFAANGGAAAVAAGLGVGGAPVGGLPPFDRLGPAPLLQAGPPPGLAALPAADLGLDDYARRFGFGGQHLLGSGLGPSPSFAAASPLWPIADVDERVLKVMVSNGERWRSWEDVLRDCLSPPQPNWGAHLKGSPSVLEAFRGFRHVGGPVGHHREWTRANGLAGEPHCHEHYTLCAAIELLICFDQLNAPSLLSVELLMRRLMLSESASEVGAQGRPDFFHAEEIMGYLQRASGAVIALSWESEATDRLKTRAEISKQLPRAKETVKPAAKAKGAGKGAEA
jgi:hypothetical protein